MPSSFSSPAMKLFLASTSKSDKTKKGYYGGMNFLDNQEEFTKTFGSSPTLLPSKPIDNDNGSTISTLHTYSGKCQLDIFMYLCMLDFVGHDKINPSLNLFEVCRKISELKQVQSVNGRLITDIPEELFDRFNEISVSLPENASTWTLQLCLSYLSALTSDLLDAVTSDNLFIIPDLSKLVTKAMQIDALHTVRTQASARYRDLKKEKEKMTVLLRSLNTT